ncbi:MAG: glycosyltransferase family 2 protein [Bacteroidetes bacterium]|nr:glycosyltransferase family 2 protein [Bacteroidota bacterium]
MSNCNFPKVSVCMITYNHENFIREAIEGVLMQVCDFEVELIVANDCSTDKTDRVIQDIIQNHPNASWINYTNHTQNKGMIPNFIWAMQQCIGEYIALCEGDDYWTDTFKLKKQVDFLERSEDYNICFHNVKLFNQAENRFENDNITRNVHETSYIEDLARGNFIHTPSVVLRNNFTIPKWYSKSPIGDWILYMIAIKDKKIKKLDKIMAVYRVHEKGVWVNKSQEYKDEFTKISINLLLKNLKSKKEVYKILKNRLGNVNNKKLNFVKLLELIKNKINSKS